MELITFRFTEPKLNKANPTLQILNNGVTFLNPKIFQSSRVRLDLLTPQQLHYHRMISKK